MRPITGLGVVSAVCLLLAAAVVVFPQWEESDGSQVRSRGFAPIWSPPSPTMAWGLVEVDRTRQIVGLAGCLVLWILACRRIIRVARG